MLLLAGCVPPDPIITPEPGPGATPVFASDEEALAAATDAYSKYLKVSNTIRADGGKDPARISEFVSADQLPDELDGFKTLAEKGYSTVGDITADTIRLQQYTDGPERQARVVIYVCLDATNVRVVDAAGKTVNLPQQPTRQLFEISMESAP
ncbi:MAG: hypothetical protein KF808_04070, partial [Cryobacterium sp.]|nr:hypothetical protein [Cryobacterium sp.]